MDLGNHAGFIIASYAITLAVIVAVIVWVRIDYATQKKLLADLEARGVRRRSDKKAAPAATAAKPERETA